MAVMKASTSSQSPIQTLKLRILGMHLFTYLEGTLLVCHHAVWPLGALLLTTVST